MEERPKYGRRKLPDDEKRSIVIQICVNSKEFRSIQKRFSKENIGPVLRKFILNSEKRIHKNDDEAYQIDSNIVYELKKIGTNLNQIAFKINVGEFVPGEQLEKHLHDVKQIIENNIK